MRKFKNRSRKLARQSYWGRYDRDSYQCPDCGRGESEIPGQFEVHHQNGEPMDNRPENQVGLCRLCHNLREGKKPSIAQIRDLRDNVSVLDSEDSDTVCDSTADVRSVYLAGTMTYQGDEGDSYWSPSVSDNPRSSNRWRNVLGELDPVDVNSPKDLHFNHGGGFVGDVAESDLDLLNESDAILAYFDKKEQVGTLTELMHAVSEGMPALVLFHSRFVRGPAVSRFEDIDESYQWVNHIAMRAASPVYWFLINYLAGDSGGRGNSNDRDGVEADVRVGVVSDLSGIRDAYREWAEPAMERVSYPDIDETDICRICGSSRDKKAWIAKGTDREKKVCADCAHTLAWG